MKAWRRDSSAEGWLNCNRPFMIKGTITAVTASQMSDGAAVAVLVSDEKAIASGLTLRGLRIFPTGRLSS